MKCEKENGYYWLVLTKKFIYLLFQFCGVLLKVCIESVEFFMQHCIFQLIFNATAVPCDLFIAMSVAVEMICWKCDVFCSCTTNKDMLPGFI